MPSAMRTGFTAYLQNFYEMCCSHEPQVKKLIYDQCYSFALERKEGHSKSLPKNLPFYDAVVLKVAREIYDVHA
jgi:hypothetical protein